MIRALLAEAGDQKLGARVRARAERAVGNATPESYLGAERAARFVNGLLREGTARFRLPARGAKAIPLDHLGLEGRWRVEASRAVAAGRDARLYLRFTAQRVFLVLGSPHGPRQVDVVLDGRRQRAVRVGSYRLYDIVRLPEPGSHLLTLELRPGIEAYAFTFG